MTSSIKEQVRADLKIIKANSRMAKRLDAFRTVFEKTDRILSGHPVKVVMSVIGSSAHTGMPNIPGWTDGETIFLNADVIRNDLGKLSMPMIVLHVKAVNLHELCHVIYSPRMRDDIMKWVLNQRNQDTTGTGNLWWYAFNALEDQRIESLFVAKYGPSAPYFEAIALKWLVNNQASMPEAFPLVYGRKFMRADIVAKARAAFVARYGEGLAQDFETVINRFTILKFPDHTVAAQKAITQYKGLLVQMMAQHPQMNGMPTPSLMSDDNGGVNGPQHRDDPTVVRKNNARKRDQQKALDNLHNVEPRPGPGESDKDDKSDSDEDGQGQGELDDTGDETDGDDAAGDGDGEGQTTDAEGMGSAPSQSGDGQEGDGEQPSDESSSDAPAGEGSPGTGSSEAGQGSNAEQEAMDAVYDALDELMQDEMFREELDATADAIHKTMNDEGMADGSAIPYADTLLNPDVIRTAKRMATTLGRLRSELEEQHLYRQTAGQVHPRRFLSRKPWEIDFFKVFEPGLSEQADVEAVILVDLSSSMYSQMKAVNESLWTVKRALEILESRVTVLGFSNDGYVLYQPTEKVNRTSMRFFSANGGTNPDKALEEAHRLFRSSRRTQKLLVSITDGDWQGDRRKQLELVEAMHVMDVVTCLIGIGAAPKGVDHGHQIVHHLAGINEMPKVAVQIVAQALRNLLEQVPTA